MWEKGSSMELSSHMSFYFNVACTLSGCVRLLADGMRANFDNVVVDEFLSYGQVYNTS